MSDLIDYRDDYFKDMLWIGLLQVDDNNSAWEWSDGTPLENGTNNQNWYEKLGYTTEPNDPNEACVGVSTKRCKGPQNCGFNNTDDVGKWGDKTCSTPQKFLCENREYFVF